jgi:hypothetical protein
LYCSSQIDRFTALYHTLLDYFGVAENGRLGTVPPLDASAEPKAADAGAAAGAKGAKGAAAKPAPAAAKAAGSTRKGLVSEPEPVAVAADPLEEAVAAAAKAATNGRLLALSALRNLAGIKAAQDTERRLRWAADLTAIATEKEAREAAAAEAAGAKGKGGAKAKPAAKPAAKGAKGAEVVVEESNPNFVFVNESVLEALVHEARQVVDRLDYLVGRCRAECGQIAEQTSTLFADLLQTVSSAAAIEGAAVEAFAAFVQGAIEGHSQLQATLLLQVR